MKLPLSLNADFIDSQYQLWKSSPDRVSREWRAFFEGFELGAFPEHEAAGLCDKAQVMRQSHVEELIYRYRDLGHLLACLDPLVSCAVDHPLLTLSAFNLSESDLDRTFYTPHFPHAERMPLREVLHVLKETYCRTIGVEYMHLQDPRERRWLQERMEPVRNQPNLTREERVRILRKLVQATIFEQFLHARYVGQKRFSIEGAEVVVAMLDSLVQDAARQGYREIILGMAHRGRLNVQVNVLEKPYGEIFCEFEDNYNPDALVGSGDVKYHKGFLSDIRTDEGYPMRIVLVNNPSHLESVDPVVEGVARARQEHFTGQDGRLRVLPILIHGDAGFSGQGVVFETLNLSQLDGYRTGGTVHIIINNQIGFTTLPEHARSTRYSTDVAKMLMVPIFHVHGEDPDAAVHVTRLANEYRREFGKDVVIDVVCYRRYGHNEGDEPYFTQPLMYARIKDRPPAYQFYSKGLISDGVITREEMERMERDTGECLDRSYREAHGKTCEIPEPRFFEDWHGIHGNYSHEAVETAVSGETLLLLARKLDAYPEGFSVHKRLERILHRRLEAVEKSEGIDWATAEALAFASLLIEGAPVRLSGQDSRRGTFSQRHSVLVDTQTGEEFTPLNHLASNQAPFMGYDSILSENAVLGFEYGYSLASPRSLTIWEAQFGDFANNAQVVIDQYIASAEAKWSRLSGLVLLLPHSFEGQGPEHSSARLERFLQLCAGDNIQVCNATTPAQYFHLLRRQVKRDLRKPLIVMTPKSLLRHPRAVSKLADLTSGRFREVLDDEAGIESPRCVIFCSGKIYYDLLARREESDVSDVAIVRIEQFYPFPVQQLKEIVSQYESAAEWLWVQEEPQNMGGWSFMHPRLAELIGRAVGYVGRPPAASPAVGLLNVHRQEQEAVLNKAFE